MLFVQLALIRWAGANLVHLSYFSNLILLASFLGIGLGFLRSRRPHDFGRYAPVALIVLIAFITIFPAQIMGSSADLIFFTEVAPTGLPTWVSLPLVFVVVAITMTGFGEITGRAFREFKALDAYRWDIIGSILGTLAFTLVSFMRAPSWVWPIVTLVILVLIYGVKLPAISWVAMVVIIAALVMESLGAGISWSPYYKIHTESFKLGDGSTYTALPVNGIPHQAVMDVKQRLALANGAKHVDAVEIDPRIAQIGEQVNPNKPYDDSRVDLHINDGRAFLSSTDQKYDLILFALPDSLTLVSGASQLRLESYLFTKQSMEAARDHLTSAGVFAMYNFYREPWLVNRLAGTLDEVFGHAPCVDSITVVQSIAVLTVGKQPQNATCAAGTIFDRAAIAQAGDIVPAPSTDDHPFLYLRDRSIPPLYLIVIALILLASAIGIRVFGGPYRSMSGYVDLFFMGSAFLLLETRSITTFALLFGTTWLVNAMVFTGVLVAVLLAIEVTSRRKRPVPRRFIISALFGSLGVAFLIPNGSLLGLPVPLRLLAAVILAFAPVFFANLLFTSRFKDSANPTAAFAANLFGAMVGGCLEYLSLLIGYQFLLLIAVALYVIAVLAERGRAGRGTVPTIS